jgi:hypothetical protein
MFIQVNSNGAPFLPASSSQKMNSSQPAQQAVSCKTHGQEEDDDAIDHDNNSSSRTHHQQQQQPRPQQDQQRQQGSQQQQQQPQEDATQQQEGYEELACAPDDEDLNTTYNCGTCSRVMKGKVMLQAHQFQAGLAIKNPPKKTHLKNPLKMFFL